MAADTPTTLHDDENDRFGERDFATQRRLEAALKLLVGSRKRYPGWTTLDLAPGPDVDYVGDCQNLSQLDANSVEALYASQLQEHVAYADLPGTLAEWHRVLMPDGKLMVAVPDMNILSQLFIKPELRGADKVLIMQMMFGGQLDKTDFHCIGFDLELLGVHLHKAGFAAIRRVESFGLFEDMSLMAFRGIKVSLNIEATKPRAARPFSSASPAR